MHSVLYPRPRSTTHHLLHYRTQDDLLAIGWTPKERDGWAEFGGVWRHRFTSKPTEDQKGEDPDSDLSRGHV